MVELSYVAMALIGAYLVIGTVRYFISGRSLAAKVAEAFGLR